MSRLNDLLRQLETKDAALAKDLRREVDALADRRAFGLNFERHVPEAVELPGRSVRRGDKVRVLPPKDSKFSASDDRLWRVVAINKGWEGGRAAHLELVDGGVDVSTALVEDLVVVVEFRDTIYPGLVSTGKVERGGDKPFHTVINAENYHALQTLLFTHRAKVDAIYIDPPYNTGARDWKYNNDYVEGEDLYRHSKWLAFMERRLKLCRELLNPDDSVLIVTIDEKEYLRLGLLLEQTFPEARIQMNSVIINSQGTPRVGAFSRIEEYMFTVQLGRSAAVWSADDMYAPEAEEGRRHSPQVWYPLIRSGTDPFREDAPAQFYPIFVDPRTKRIVDAGDPLPLGVDRGTVAPPTGLEIVWPILGTGRESRWQLSRESLLSYIQEGYVRAGDIGRGGVRSVTYLRKGTIARIAAGEIVSSGRDERGALLLTANDLRQKRRPPKTVWDRSAHEAGEYGSKLLRRMMPDRKFPFPKSLYAVENALSFFVKDKPDATVLDFFSGSGTTAHAVMRLNKQDGGRRQCISVTNNEVSADEQKELRKHELRPGDPEWEVMGICEYITKPRVTAAITGLTPTGHPIKGDYKFTDEFPMADGFEENVEFFTLSYEAPLRVASNREFEKIAPLLWLRAGSEGCRIEDVSAGWDVADTYGVLVDLNQAEKFIESVANQTGVRIAYIVTDEDRLFENVVRELPDHVEPVRLYEAYLRNFEIETARSAL